MKRALTLFCVLAWAALRAEPLAWIRFTDTYDQMGGTNYHWLAHQYLDVTFEAPPGPARALDLLWGSKDDQRGLVVVEEGARTLVQDGGYRGFKTVRVPLAGGATGPVWRVRIERPEEGKVGFLAGLRLVDAATPLSETWPTAAVHRVRYRALTDPRPPVDADWHPEMRARWDRPLSIPGDGTPGTDAFRRAERSGRLAAEAWYRCHLYTRGWLARADPASGLIPENLRQGRDRWNGRNAAADNYPFLVLTAAFTDRPALDGRMLDLLRAEQRLTSRLGRLGDSYLFSTRGFEFPSVDFDRLVFDNTEYVKDGLLPIAEWLGASPWSERMRGLMEDLWKNPPVKTAFGNLPTRNPEILGDLLQAGARLYAWTGDKTQRDQAARIADLHLLGDRHPTRHGRRLGLNDHACEVVAGLSELYAVCPEFRDRWRAPLREMYDFILDHARNPHGLLYEWVDIRTRAHSEILSDTWGYTYNAIHTFGAIENLPHYRAAVRRVLGNLRPHYTGAMWQGGSADGFADALEGALSLANREPGTGAEEWIDTEMRRMWLIQLPDGIVEGWHGDGNFARTSLMYALWKTQGLTPDPWRPDLVLGAERDGDRLVVVLTADEPWSGRLRADRPRHREILHLPFDYARINHFPETFTLSAADRVQVRIDANAPRELPSPALTTEGLALELQAGETRRLELRRLP